MKCPICSDNLIIHNTGNDSNELFVAEQFETSVEVFDDLVKLFKCSKNHIVYISEDSLK